MGVCLQKIGLELALEKLSAQRLGSSVHMDPEESQIKYVLSPVVSLKPE